MLAWAFAGGFSFNCSVTIQHENIVDCGFFYKERTSGFRYLKSAILLFTDMNQIFKIGEDYEFKTSSLASNSIKNSSPDFYSK
jgi:hypothetical protein